MTQGKTVCECGRDDIHSSKDCWTIENRIKALNELAKQAQELDMGYSFTLDDFLNDTKVERERIEKVLGDAVEKIHKKK